MFKSMALGMVLGATIGVMVLPQLDRRTQKSIKRTGQKMMCLAEDAYDNMMYYIK